jgi:hypothetical protein
MALERFKKLAVRIKDFYFPVFDPVRSFCAEMDGQRTGPFIIGRKGVRTGSQG